MQKAQSLCMQEKNLVGKAGLNKLHQSFNSLFLIGAAGNNANIGSAHDTERKDTEKTLCVDSSFFLFNPN